MTDLANSKRHRYTATYVTKRLTSREQRMAAKEPGDVLRKLNVLGSLSLDREALARIRELSVHADAPDVGRALEAVMALQRSGIQPETLRALSQVSNEELARLGRFASQALDRDAGVGALLDPFDQLDAADRVLPVGWLFLERIETYPVGVERGEMVFTIPMAPKETITVSHKEWSTSSQEYTEIIDDYFEGYSERGVVDKTDVSTSTENESRHNSSLNFGATLSGGACGVTLTTSMGLSSSDEERSSVKQSMQHNREVTEKASARARKQHKVSVKLETKKGVEDSSFRTITNDRGEAVRIDFYRMMRKWRNDLYRYDVRMTYDITIPTPGMRLWALWQRVRDLDRRIAAPFSFERPDGSGPILPSDITETPGKLSWADLGNAYRVSVGPPPPLLIQLDPLSKVVTTGQRALEIFEFTAPDGYELESTADARISYWGGGTGPLMNISDDDWAATRTDHKGSGPGDGWYGVTLDTFGSPHKREVTVVVGDGAHLSASMTCKARRTAEHFRQWQHRTWAALREAAQRLHAEAIAGLQEERDKLWRALTGKDTLSLRRLEREELLRLVMLWILGPLAQFSNAPAAIEEALDKILKNEMRLFDRGAPPPKGGSPTFTGLSPHDRSSALMFGEMVTFVHQAIEWENLLYFLYPYYWGSEAQGRDRLLFEHGDPEHERFLRAGYARVVVTVRPGFEGEFLAFAETGSRTGQVAPHKLTIAEQIRTFAQTNYQRIPPANPEKHARPLLYPQQRKTWDIMQRVVEQLEKFHAELGLYPDKLTDLPGGAMPTDAWGRDLVYRMPGSGNEYDLFSYGANGEPGGDGADADISAGASASLVASWFDYSPTSGLDIEIGTDPSVIA